MEGGSLPWKTQTIVNNSPDISTFSKPLPPPPHGFYWEKKQDDSWELLAVQNDSVNGVKRTKVENPSVIEHTVMPSDTFQGICLRYHVSATELRRVNMFSGNNIQFIKTLKIPLAPGVEFESQVDGPEVLVRRFSNLTNEGHAEATLYLQENGWDVDKAFAQWQVDENWEHQQHLEKVRQVVLNGTVVAPEQVVECAPERGGSRHSHPHHSAEADKLVEMQTLNSLIVDEDAAAAEPLLA